MKREKRENLRDARKIMQNRMLKQVRGSREIHEHLPVAPAQHVGELEEQEAVLFHKRMEADMLYFVFVAVAQLVKPQAV